MIKTLLYKINRVILIILDFRANIFRIIYSLIIINQLVCCIFEKNTSTKFILYSFKILIIKYFKIKYN